MMRHLLTLCIALLTAHLVSAQANLLTEIATINLSPTFGIAISGDYLYANPGFSDVRIYDISNPAAPQVLP